VVVNVIETNMLERLFRQDDSGGDSDLWYRVAHARPRVSPHARITRQRSGRSNWYIVEDPVAGEFYRVTEAAYLFLGLLDGRRTVQQAFDACSAQLGDQSPTQRECIEVLSRMQYHGILSEDLPLGAAQVSKRRRDAAKKRRTQRLGFGLSINIPLINPEPLLERLAPAIRLVFSRWGLAAWLVAVAIGLYAALSHLDQFAGQLNSILSPSNLVWLGVAFIILRAWHEFGHACAVKAFGGRCTEVGLILMALVIPFPYCDASASYRFPSPIHRALVGAGGMLFETFLAAIAAVVWSVTEPGLVHTIAHNAMIISSITTLAFNANPLLRYDGYYILTDLTATPNLWNRSRELLKYLMERLAFGIRSAKPPILRDRAEFWLMLVYALLSYPYRFIVLATIIWVLWTQPAYFGLGVILALVAACLWIAWPALKSLSYLLWSSRLMGRRTRALGVVGVTLALVATLVGLIPFPAPAYATAVVYPRAYQTIRPNEDGFVDRVLVRVGDAVDVGQPLLLMRSPDLEAELARMKAAYERAIATADTAPGGPSGDLYIADLIVAQARRDVDRIQARIDSLTVRALVAGKVAALPGSTGDLDALSGRFVEKGGAAFAIADTDAPRFRALVVDREYGRAFAGRTPDIHVRVRGDAGREITATIDRVEPIASTQIYEAALTATSGGEILMDPEDQSGSRALRPHFLVDLAPQLSPDVPLPLPGQRARVRFDGVREPLAQQWIRRIRQSLSDRTGL
jgi:putative peptide zinc metalloprotease protein